MKKNCRFVVRFGKAVAKFSHYSDALRFARLASMIGSAWQTGGSGYAELSDKSGLLAQFEDGKPTPEFAHVD